MTENEICERLLQIAGSISFTRGRVSNEEDVYKAVDCATNALDTAYESVVSLVLAVRPKWTTKKVSYNKETMK